MQRKILVTLLIASALLRADNIIYEVDEFSPDTEEMAETRGKSNKCKTFRNLAVCNTLTAGNLTITGNEAVSGNVTIAGNTNIAKILTAASLALGNSTIALSSGGNLLDYGYFYSFDTGAMTGVILTPSTTTAAYAAIGAGACGITVVNAGTYLVWLYIWGSSNGAWTINAEGVPVTGAVFSNNYPPGSFGPATGLAIVTFPANGQTITITGDNLEEPQGGVPANLGIIRLQ